MGKKKRVSQKKMKKGFRQGDISRRKKEAERKKEEMEKARLREGITTKDKTSSGPAAINSCSELRDLVRRGGYSRHAERLQKVIEMSGEEMINSLLVEEKQVSYGYYSTRKVQKPRFTKAQATKAVDFVERQLRSVSKFHKKLEKNVEAGVLTKEESNKIKKQGLEKVKQVHEELKPVRKFYKMLNTDVEDGVIRQDEKDEIKKQGYEKVIKALERLREHTTPLKVLLACRHSNSIDQRNLPKPGQEPDYEILKKQLMGQVVFHGIVQDKLDYTDVFEEVMKNENPSLLERKLKAAMERGCFEYLDTNDRNELHQLLWDWDREVHEKIMKEGQEKREEKEKKQYNG